MVIIPSDSEDLHGSELDLAEADRCSKALHEQELAYQVEQVMAQLSSFLVCSRHFEALSTFEFHFGTIHIIFLAYKCCTYMYDAIHVVFHLSSHPHRSGLTRLRLMTSSATMLSSPHR